MKKLIVLLFLVVCVLNVVSAQKVDSIRVEQSGDFIKIRYKILDSEPGQTYRVKVLCSINGGLNTELRSISGDAGDQIPGGKPEYWVVWDVLKDVEEVKSVDFIIRAELNSSARKRPGENTTGWDKKRVYIMPAVLMPGPKAGLRLGVLGSFGITGQVVQGKIVIDDDDDVAVVDTDSPSLTADFTPSRQLSVSLDLAKRIVNREGFQMHLLVGFQRTRLAFMDPDAMLTPYHEEKVFGPESGLAFGVKRLAFTVMLSHFDPGQVEEDGDFVAASPFNYLSFSFGARF